MDEVSTWTWTRMVIHVDVDAQYRNPAGVDGTRWEPTVGDTVLIVKPRAPYEVADAVITDVQEHPLPLDGGGLLPSKLYGLGWADGEVTWHHKHEFAPICGNWDAR